MTGCADRARHLLAGVLLASALLPTAAPGAAPPADAPIHEVLAALVAEAQHAQREAILPRREADFARSFPKKIDPANVLPAITARAHRDPFIDAYVRWQLTSFEPDLAALDDEAFLELLRSAPAMVPNPRAAPDLASRFARLNDAGPRDRAELRRIHEVEHQLDDDTNLAERMNRPAELFYDWVGEQLGERGIRPRQWLLARCAATIDAGWPTRSVKTAITRSFTAGAGDDSITPDDRRTLLRQTGRLVGRQRRFIRQVTYRANGSVRVTFSTAAVDEDDLQHWTARLLGEPDR